MDTESQASTRPPFIHRRGAIYAGRDLLPESEQLQLLTSYSHQLTKALIEGDRESFGRFSAAGAALVRARAEAVLWLRGLDRQTVSIARGALDRLATAAVAYVEAEDDPGDQIGVAIAAAREALGG